MNILVLPGDGIGPEITRATLQVLEAADRRFALGLRFETADIGFAALEASGTTLPDEVPKRARAADGILLGPIDHMAYPPRDQGGVNVSAAFRTGLDLFANIRPARTRPGVPHRGSDMDLVIVRECTEGMYPDRNMARGIGEFMPDPDMALSVRKITRRASTRIARVAFELARRRRRRVTTVHKANNFVMTDGLFLEAVRAVAGDYPDVEASEIIVDAMAAHLVRDAGRFDVICTSNFHGDILSDLASELAGGLGLAGAINANDERCAAQAQHGSAPDIAGRGIANPTSLILSASMMLAFLGEKRRLASYSTAARAVETAIDRTLAETHERTPDLGGNSTTETFATAVVRALESTPT